MEPGRRAAAYRRLLSTSLNNGDLTTAAFGAEALVQMYPDSKLHRYNRGLVHAQAEEKEAAQKIMTELAVNAGYAKAARWLAYAAINGRVAANIPPEQRIQVIEWLSLAIENDASHAETKRLKAEFQTANGDPQGAYNTILPIANTSTATRFQTLLLEKGMGLDEQAKERSEALIRLLKETLADNPQEAQIRLQLATVQVIADRVDDAIEVLSTGRQVCPAESRQTLDVNLVDALVFKFKGMRQADRSPSGLARCLELLRYAMSIAPSTPSLVEAFTQLRVEMGQKGNDELPVLQELIAEGLASEAAHFVLGTIELDRGNISAATNHLEIAAKTNPNLPGLLNNLAYSLLQSEEPDLERALRLSDASIRSLPTNPYFRETRGQIYFRMKKYKDAISDLEKALPAEQLRSLIRPSLAEAYDAIGNPQMAKLQRELLSQGK